MTFFEADQADRPGTEVLLKRVHEVISNARPMPLSASVMINKDELLELLDEAIARLPDEIRQARWLLKERQEFLDKVQREGDDILDAARVRAERMVQRTEIVRAAEAKARRTIEEANDEARRLRLEAEDYCDQKLAQFEIILDDYVQRPGVRTALKATLYSLTAVLMIMGTAVIVTFDPAVGG